MAVGDDAALEGMAAARREEEGHVLAEFIENPEIIVGDRWKLKPQTSSSIRYRRVLADSSIFPQDAQNS